MLIVDKIVDLHLAFEAKAMPHAFGGALALAWCTEHARGTIDIDVNVFVDPGERAQVVQALPAGVEVTERGLTDLERDGQTRLWWTETPIDLFLNTTEFHAEVGTRARFEDFAGHRVPFLACRDLAVFKAFFDRPKDWVDLSEMAAAGCLDVQAVLGVLALYLGGDDYRVEKVRQLAY